LEVFVDYQKPFHMTSAFKSGMKKKADACNF